MQKLHILQPKLSILPTDLQMNYNGHFLITMSSTNNESRKFIENNKDRNWNQKQIQKFAAFLYYHHQKLRTIDTRKANKIFKLLSHYLQSRNINQCRTFTFKMIKKFGNLHKLNSFFEQSLPFYQQIINRQKFNLQNIKLSAPENKQPYPSNPQKQSQQFQNKSSIPNPFVQQKKDIQLKPTDTQYYVEQNNAQTITNKSQFNFQKIHSYYRKSQYPSYRKSHIFQESPLLMELRQGKNENGEKNAEQISQIVRGSNKSISNPQQYRDLPNQGTINS